MGDSDLEAKDNDDAGHVSHDEAEAILHRFNASHWGNHEERARYSIPADPKRDDDIRLAAYIAAARKTEADRDALAAEVARLRPLAELGALALAWGRACVLVGVARDRRRADGYMVETAGPTLAQQVNNETDAGVALRFAAMKMANEEQKR